MARYCDLASAVVGEHEGRSGEANSVSRPELPDGQLEWLMGLKRMGIPLVVVVLAGRPLCVPWLADNADAILWAWHPGTLGGQAIAEVLVGIVNPSAKLPVTFPRSVGQIPLYYNRKRTGRPLDPYAKGASRYVDESDAPLFPFGFGLGYSAFEYADLGVEKAASGFSVTCSVQNVGAVDGDEVAQLYVTDRVSTYARPVKELKLFTRLSIPAGQTRKARFDLAEEAFGYYDPLGRWLVEPGEFEIWVGPDSTQGLRAAITV
jgi:beta-glucosidase